MKEETEGIAIVGIDCRFPGANNIHDFWNNIICLRQQFRKIPTNRLDLRYYFSENNPDQTYCKYGAFITDYTFDRIKYKISKSTFEQTDFAHWLSLDVAFGALKDAGFENGTGLNKETTGVIIGNSLNSEFSRANLLRIRWPYVHKTIEKVLYLKGFERAKINDLLKEIEFYYKSPFPEPGEDTLVGSLSNTIAGRICNYFDFKGGGFTIDGACASSLLALSKACESLQNKDLDVVITGGVDLSIDPLELVGFARNKALASTEMNVFSDSPQGFLPGEGCGMIILVRESDAIKNHLKVYSVIRGWGISSDGQGIITRPKIETQQLAMQRAYEKAQYSISDVNMFEAHGTGTSVGDEIELSALLNLLKREKTIVSPLIIGSVKHLIGHAKAAAGIAGIIKASLSSYFGIIPPSIINKPLHKLLVDNEDFIRMTDKEIFMNRQEPFRIGVSSYGFGGINVHITLENLRGNNNNNNDYNPTPINLKSRYKCIHRDYEIFPVSDFDKNNFISKIAKLKTISLNLSHAEFTDLSISLTKVNWKGSLRAVIIANSPSVLSSNLELLLEALSKQKEKFISHGIYFNVCNTRATNAFLFPGQAVPVYEHLGAYNAFSDIKEDYFKVKQKYKLDSIQSSIILNNKFSVEILKSFGVFAEYGIGYSLGEMSALNWGKKLNDEQIFELVKLREDALRKHADPDGAMLVLQCSISDIDFLKQYAKFEITGYNDITNFTVGGHLDEINTVKLLAHKRKIPFVQLKISNAFHTQMIYKAAKKYREAIEGIESQKGESKIISTLTGSLLPEELEISDHLYKQMVHPVLFSQSIESIKNDVTFFFELGSGKVLSNLLKKNHDINIISLDFASDSIKGLLDILSASFVSGYDINFYKLSEGRYYKEFDYNTWNFNFLTNPCETELPESVNYISLNINEKQDENIQITHDDSENTLKSITQALIDLISKKMEIPANNISEDYHIVSQLHLNSLTIAEIISMLIKKYNRKFEVFSKVLVAVNSDATLKEICTVIFKEQEGLKNVSEIDLDVLPSWTHIFVKKYERRKIKNFEYKSDKNGSLILNSTIDFDNKNQLVNQLSSIGNFASYIYSSSLEVEIYDFIKFLNSLENLEIDAFLLIDIQSNKDTINDLKPILRSYSQENSELKIISLEIDYLQQEKIFDIIKNAFIIRSKYQEIICDKEGVCREPYFEVIFPHKRNNLKNIINEKDVILVTGGGKGITFQSIFMLATKTNCKLAILGRTNPEKDEELKRNLTQLVEKNVNYKYYIVDVLDKRNIKRVRDKIFIDLGEITILIHGAGVNNPVKIRNLQKNDIERTLSVKKNGLENIMSVIHATNLKFLIGYGSIISETGMQGNADYAYANDQLARSIEKFGVEHSMCKCMTFEWSIWNTYGMGIKLNSIEILRNQGVSPISLNDALNSIEKLITDDRTPNGRYIITGRIGKRLQFRTTLLPNMRFTSIIRHFIPDIEIVSDVRVNLNTDLYLKHHVFNGQYIFPTVFILEGIAQVCSALCPNIYIYRFENLNINQSIFIPENEDSTIRFIATRISEEEIKVQVQSEETNFSVDCFDCSFIFNNNNPIKKMNINDSFTDIPIHDFDIKKRFYDDLLFHSEMFHRIKSFYKINSKRSVALLKTNNLVKWYASNISETNLLGDPGTNDAAIHCHQACRPESTLLPTKVKNILINPNIVDEQLYILTEEIYEDKDETIINSIVVNEKGEIKEIWEGLSLASVKGIKFKGEWDIHFLLPLLEYKIRKKRPEITDPEITLEDCRFILEQFNAGVKEVFFSKNRYDLFLLINENRFVNEDSSFELTLQNQNNLIITIELICQ
ncbi:MAG: SDR family NAD(P)-dependent oxidoreductase [Bacteroidales bacterium]|jgi:enediyne polyketide synthase|nr:SDR family NAD(P)-dependent oxidoreductase [Bacteroidales bacterium]